MDCQQSAYTPVAWTGCEVLCSVLGIFQEQSAVKHWRVRCGGAVLEAKHPEG